MEAGVGGLERDRSQFVPPGPSGEPARGRGRGAAEGVVEVTAGHLPPGVARRPARADREAVRPGRTRPLDRSGEFGGEPGGIRGRPRRVTVRQVSRLALPHSLGAVFWYA